MTGIAQETNVGGLAKFVNDFFEVVSRVVYEHGGIVNNFFERHRLKNCLPPIPS